MKKRSWLYSILFLVLTIPAMSQTGSQISIQGRVLDGGGAALAGASLILINTATGQERVLTTDAEGRYKISAPYGRHYKLTVKSSGFSSLTKEITPSSDTSVDFTLEPGSVTDSVTVYSASRQEELRESLDTKVDVISRTLIRDTGYESVGEILQELPGVITRTGTLGSSVAGEQIQGLDSRQVLVLYDGQPLTGSRGIKRGILNLDRQSVNNLEQVEVVKGASSALYGSDAIGGVINQITRDPRYPIETSFVTSGGSLNRLDTRADIGFAGEKLLGFYSFERHKQNDWDLTPTTLDTTGAGFHRYDAYAKMKYKFSPKFSMTAWARSYWNEETGRAQTETGPYQQAFTNDDSQSFNLTSDWLVNDRTAVQARGFFSRFDEHMNGRIIPTNASVESGNLFERLGKIDASVSRRQGSRQNFQAGVEWMHDTYGGINRLQDNKKQSIDFASVWAQDKINITSRLTTTIGFRFDNHSIFGSAVSPKAGANFRITENWRVHASYGRGFRAPDLGQLRYRFANPTSFYQVIGNPTLKAEYANSFQIGTNIYALNRKARLGINLFRNNVDDLIESVVMGTPRTQSDIDGYSTLLGYDIGQFNPLLGRMLFVYQNINDALTRGVEVDGELVPLRGFTVGGAYTFLEAEDRARNRSLLNRFKHQGSVRFGWNSSQRLGIRLNLRGTFFGTRLVAYAPTASNPDNTPPAYSLWDMYGAKCIFSGFEIFGGLDNLTNSKDPNLDKTYISRGVTLPLTLNRPEYGRTFRIGMRWDWARESR